MRGLEGKNVIVTGGGGAIGGAICRRFAELRREVGVFDKNLDGADEGRGRDQEPAASPSVGVDIADYAAVGKAIAEFEARGRARPTSWSTTPAGTASPTSSTPRPTSGTSSSPSTCAGPLNMSHVVLTGMVARGHGRIVNIASDAGRVGSSQEAVYSACKGGIIAFTKTVAREVARKGITLNAVCPGPTDTPLLAAVAGDGERGQKMRAALVNAIPMKRVGKPEDIPGAVASSPATTPPSSPARPSACPAA